MIVFYKPNTVKTTIPKVVAATRLIDCDTSCAANCIKPKSKCCNKYKKKGINCKRCPKILLQTAS